MRTRLVTLAAASAVAGVTTYFFIRGDGFLKALSRCLPANARDHLRRLYRNLARVRPRQKAIDTFIGHQAPNPTLYTQKTGTSEAESRNHATGPPSCSPLDTVQQLMQWHPDHSPPAQHTPWHPKPSFQHPDQPKLLVCHDMMGGYHQDALLQGGSDANFYRLWHWDSIDIFVYFSHHFVTIPPPGWIHAAHTHGTKVLGTFITEWDEGRRKCEELLSSCVAAEEAAEQLVAIAQQQGFDGWLINIENSLTQQHVQYLLHFLRHLRKRMAQQVPHSLVIWYDAVTTEGKLEWQNTVSPLNMPFLEATDAIFINYTWKAGTPADIAAWLGSRRADVYMGVDVFGRGTYGGGQMACDVALAAARQQGLSAALFAPGWVYENHDRGDWQQVQRSFWASIEQAWPAAAPSITTLPLHTNFNPGCGQQMCAAGSRLPGSGPWFNLSAQQRVPAEQLLQACCALQLQRPAAGAEVARLVDCGACGVEVTAGVSGAAAYEGSCCVELRCSCGEGSGGELLLCCCRLFDMDVRVGGGQELSVSCVAGGEDAAALVVLLWGGERVWLLAAGGCYERLRGMHGVCGSRGEGGREVQYCVVQADVVADAVGSQQVLLGQCLPGSSKLQREDGGVAWRRFVYTVEVAAGVESISGCGAGLLLAAEGCGQGAQQTALLGGLSIAYATSTQAGQQQQPVGLQAISPTWQESAAAATGESAEEHTARTQQASRSLQQAAAAQLQLSCTLRWDCAAGTPCHVWLQELRCEQGSDGGEVVAVGSSRWLGTSYNGQWQAQQVLQDSRCRRVRWLVVPGCQGAADAAAAGALSCEVCAPV